MQVGTATTWANVDGGAEHSLATRTDGTLWAWGTNREGELGDGTAVARSAPVQVGTEMSWASATGGDFHSAALRSDGTLVAFGYNLSGQLGDGTTTTRLAPVSVGNPSNWTVVTGGESQTLAPPCLVDRNMSISYVSWRTVAHKP